MKLRFKGGHTETVVDPKTGKASEVEQLSQMLEEMEYHWPEKGSVITVPANVGGWLLAKHKSVLEELPEEASPAGGNPARRVTAVVPEKPVKPAAPQK